ncbi:MAG: response regulator transcription factor [Thermonemataceae bacterium]|nr:response regulator transcription factor [Thermonemataceae bacterium]
MIRIAVIDDQILFRKSLVGILGLQPDLHILLEDASGVAFLRYLELNGEIPDVLLLDLHLPDIDGIEILKKIRTGNLSIREMGIIILSAYSQEKYAGHLFELGANSYLSKDCEPTELLQAINEVHHKGIYLNEGLKQIIQGHKKKETKNTPSVNWENPALLTDREREIAIYLAKGFTSKEIAEIFFVSTRTIETHKTNIMLKIGAKSLAEIILYVVRMNWLVV